MLSRWFLHGWVGIALSGTIQFVQKSQAADNICGGSALPPCKFNSDAKHTLLRNEAVKCSIHYPSNVCLEISLAQSTLQHKRCTSGTNREVEKALWPEGDSSNFYSWWQQSRHDPLCSRFQYCIAFSDAGFKAYVVYCKYTVSLHKAFLIKHKLIKNQRCCKVFPLAVRSVSWPKSLATCPAKSLIVRTLSGTWTIHLAIAATPNDQMICSIPEQVQAQISQMLPKARWWLSYRVCLQSWNWSKSSSSFTVLMHWCISRMYKNATKSQKSNWESIGSTDFYGSLASKEPLQISEPQSWTNLITFYCMLYTSYCTLQIIWPVYKCKCIRICSRYYVYIYIYILHILHDIYVTLSMCRMIETLQIVRLRSRI